MGYKHEILPADPVLRALDEPNFLLKIIPHVDGTPRVCELVRYHRQDVDLPPALPAVKIEGEFYWDGGIVSNTPLQYLLDQDEDLSSLVFQVDLFSASSSLPRSMPDVLAGHKDIMYSSRTRQNTDTYARVHKLKLKLVGALKRVPEDKLEPVEKALVEEHAEFGGVNIVHLIYQHENYEGHAKDYEFSGTSMREHWDAGYEDTLRTLRHPDWLVRSSIGQGVSIHDLHREDPT